jgi:putative DNA primase/helicase
VDFTTLLNQVELALLPGPEAEEQPLLDDRGPLALPVINADEGDLAEATRQAILALERSNEERVRFFIFGQLPARLERDDSGNPVVVQLAPYKLRNELARAARYVRGKKPAHPPMDVVRDILASADLRLPVLRRVVQVPVFLPDGTLCGAPGYNAEGSVYYAPPDSFELPEVSLQPSRQEIDYARSLLLDDLLGDFPFTGPAERAHAVALALLPFARDLFVGPTPLHLIEKPSPGTGASLLAEVLLRPAIPGPIPVMTEGGSGDEWRKRITSTLLEGPEAIIIDNLRQRLQAAALAAAITSVEFRDRILGLSQNTRLPVRCAWVGTGNNPTLSREMMRRTIRIRLDARVDRPWERSQEDFRHPDLRSYAQQYRDRLCWACVTLVQAWVAEGRPPGQGALGMFEGWARAMGGILLVSGIDGFLGNLAAFYEEADEEGATMRSFIGQWWETHADDEVIVADLLPIAANYLDLGNRGEQSMKVRLGRLLGSNRERRFDYLRLSRSGDARSGVHRWRLVDTRRETV